MADDSGLSFFIMKGNSFESFSKPLSEKKLREQIEEGVTESKSTEDSRSELEIEQESYEAEQAEIREPYSVSEKIRNVEKHFSRYVPHEKSNEDIEKSVTVKINSHKLDSASLKVDLEKIRSDCLNLVEYLRKDFWDAINYYNNQRLESYEKPLGSKKMFSYMDQKNLDLPTITIEYDDVFHHYKSEREELEKIILVRKHRVRMAENEHEEKCSMETEEKLVQAKADLAYYETKLAKDLMTEEEYREYMINSLFDSKLASKKEELESAEGKANEDHVEFLLKEILEKEVKKMMSLKSTAEKYTWLIDFNPEYEESFVGRKEKNDLQEPQFIIKLRLPLLIENEWDEEWFGVYKYLQSAVWTTEFSSSYRRESDYGVHNRGDYHYVFSKKPSREEVS